MNTPLPRRILRTLLAIFAVGVLAAVAVTVYVWRAGGLAVLIAGSLQPVSYPPAPPMPSVVSESTDELLVKYEQILKDRAPAVLSSLKPGLTDAEIDTLESKNGFKLTADVRALYRWHNGTASSAATVDVFPDHRFIPLDQAVVDRDTLRGQVKSSSPAEQRAYASLAGYRDAWLDVIVDPAGDGYFFDPARSEPQGSFFFCFAEDGSYVFFPAFRNYLAAVLHGNESGTFAFGTLGAETKDFASAQALFLQFGAQNPR